MDVVNVLSALLGFVILTVFAVLLRLRRSHPGSPKVVGYERVLLGIMAASGLALCWRIALVF